jgi:bifunctional polynucleotide phosphatase/kinase
MSSWTKIESVLLRKVVAPCAIARVYAFDLDSTLIKTKSGRPFPTSATDWVFWHESVPQRLKQLTADGYLIVVFTNQAGIHQKNKTFSTKLATRLCTKIDDVIDQVGVPMVVVVATTNDKFRKPSKEMWDLFVEQQCGGVAPDLADCHFVGDAAGRPAGWRAGADKDFSNSDREFASSVGLQFHTPEACFMGEAEATEWQADEADDSEREEKS